MKSNFYLLNQNQMSRQKKTPTQHLRPIKTIPPMLHSKMEQRVMQIVAEHASDGYITRAKFFGKYSAFVTMHHRCNMSDLCIDARYLYNYVTIKHNGAIVKTEKICNDASIVTG